jgi:hypothetical protein
MRKVGLALINLALLFMFLGLWTLAFIMLLLFIILTVLEELKDDDC